MCFCFPQSFPQHGLCCPSVPLDGTTACQEAPCGLLPAEAPHLSFLGNSKGHLRQHPTRGLPSVVPLLTVTCREKPWVMSGLFGILLFHRGDVLVAFAVHTFPYRRVTAVLLSQVGRPAGHSCCPTAQRLRAEKVHQIFMDADRGAAVPDSRRAVVLTCSLKVLSKVSPGFEGKSQVIVQPYLGRYSISIACPTHAAVKPSGTFQNIPLTRPFFLFFYFSLGSDNEVVLEVRVLGRRMWKQEKELVHNHSKTRFQLNTVFLCFECRGPGSPGHKDVRKRKDFKITDLKKTRRDPFPNAVLRALAFLRTSFEDM